MRWNVVPSRDKRSNHSNLQNKNFNFAFTFELKGDDSNFNFLKLQQTWQKRERSNQRRGRTHQTHFHFRMALTSKALIKSINYHTGCLRFSINLQTMMKKRNSLLRNMRLKTEINYSLLMFSALFPMFFFFCFPEAKGENASAFMSSPVDARPSVRLGWKKEWGETQRVRES